MPFSSTPSLVRHVLLVVVTGATGCFIEWEPPSDQPDRDTAAPPVFDGCLVGAPPAGEVQAACVRAVCSESAACCGERWDAACVTAYERSCATACSDMVVVAGDGVSFRRADTGVTVADLVPGREVRDVAIADVDRDGALDLAWVDAGRWYVGVPLVTDGLYDGRIRDVASEAIADQGAPFGAGAIAWVDYDGDADLDLAITGDRGVVLVRHDPDGFVTVRPPIYARAAIEGAWTDLDADGDLDLVHGDRDQIYPVIERQTGPGQFVTEPAVDLVSFWAVRTCNVIGGVQPDLVAIARRGDLPTSMDVLTYEGTRSEFSTEMTLFAQPTVASESEPRLLECADLDRDGDLDLVFAPWGDEAKLRAVLGTLAPVAAAGPGERTVPLEPQRNTSFGLALGDLDGDGWIDAVASNGNRVELVRNATGTPGAPLALDPPRGWSFPGPVLDVELAPLP